MDSINIGALTFNRLASAADNRIESAGIFEETALVNDDLAFDTLSAELFSSSQALLDIPYGTPVQYYRNGALRSTFYKETLKRTGPNTYTLSAFSRVGLLERMEHRGGIYDGQTVSEVIKDICGPVPVYIKSSLRDIKLYGWLPYCKPPESYARDNLAQVLFALGATLGTDLDGVLRVESLWDGVASETDQERVYEEGSIDYGTAYTAVSVTEHQYMPGTDEQELFSGTAQQGDLITFDEPMHSLTATGFSILERGANYAKVSAGTGTLTGKKYIHNTRQIVRAISQAGTENVKAIDNATLVSLVNSNAVAERLAAYYKCQETINIPVVMAQEKPGYIIRIYHPYDNQMVNACLQSADINLSNTLKAQEKLLVGFVPQAAAAEYYDAMEEILDNTDWVPPPGVRSVQIVLIGGGNGGGKGGTGERGANGDTVQNNGSGIGGVGGAAGVGGSGGRIYQDSVMVQSGQSYRIVIGRGGLSDQAGGATMFGDYSSDSGAESQAGFTNIVFGASCAYAGVDGVAGGKGGGNGTAVQAGENVGEYVGGEPGESNQLGDIAGGSGGGAAMGANGENGFKWTRTDFPQPGGEFTFVFNGGTGGAGATATKAGKNAVMRGGGGDGGHGGGGGGGGGKVNLTISVGDQGQGGEGGAGSSGGSGADGIVILYYSAPKPSISGPLATADNKWYLDKHGRRFIV